MVTRPRRVQPLILHRSIEERTRRVLLTDPRVNTAFPSISTKIRRMSELGKYRKQAISQLSWLDQICRLKSSLQPDPFGLAPAELEFTHLSTQEERMFGPREQLCTSSTSLRPYDEILRLLNLSSGYYVVDGEPLMESYGRRARAYIVPSEHDIRTQGGKAEGYSRS